MNHASHAHSSSHAHTHHEHHFTQSQALRDLVLGMSDGLTVPFALAAGLSGAVDNNSIILTAGIAEVVAGSISMGLGGYLASKTAFDHFHGELKREYREIEEVPEVEKAEVRAIFSAYGLSNEVLDKLVEGLARDKDRWVDFMMKFELGLEKPDSNEASRSALRIGLAYMLGGLVPLLPYALASSPQHGLFYSSLVTLACLLVFGFFKSRFTGQPPVQGAIKVAFIGAMAAAAAFFIAKLFRI